MKITSSEYVVYINCFLFLFWHSEQFMYTTCSVLGIFMYWTRNSLNNLSSYCGLVNARISASDKYLPVLQVLYHSYCVEEQNNKLSYEIDVCGLKGWIHQVLIINKLRNKFVVGSVHSKSLVASTLDGSTTLRLYHINFSTQEFCISKEGHKKFLRF